MYKNWGSKSIISPFILEQAAEHHITLNESELRKSTTAGVLKFETVVLSTINHEETRDLANAEVENDEDRAKSLMRQTGNSFCDIVVSYSGNFDAVCSCPWFTSFQLYTRSSTPLQTFVNIWTSCSREDQAIGLYNCSKNIVLLC